MFKSHTLTRIGASKLRNLDYAERHGYIKGVIKSVEHDPGRGAPMVKVQFRNPYKYKHDKETFVAAEGLYSGQFIYCGKKGKTRLMLYLNSARDGVHCVGLPRTGAVCSCRFGAFAFVAFSCFPLPLPPNPDRLVIIYVLFRVFSAELAVGNVLPVSEMPEGTIACNVESRVGDRGVLARCSGDYVTVIGHSEENGTTKIRLPSGMKKNVPSTCVSRCGCRFLRVAAALCRHSSEFMSRVLHAFTFRRIAREFRGNKC